MCALTRSSVEIKKALSWSGAAEPSHSGSGPPVEGDDDVAAAFEEKEKEEVEKDEEDCKGTRRSSPPITGDKVGDRGIPRTKKRTTAARNDDAL